MKKDLENLGIYDLRNYARAMGVQSPTTLKRDELIAKINQIVEGETPAIRSGNKGRPPKHSATDNYVLDMILPANMFKKAESATAISKQTGYDPTLYQNIFSENKGAFPSNNVVFSGFYDDVNKDYGIVYFKGYLTDYAKENTMILRPLAEKCGLKTGDYVVGNARYIVQKNIMLATEITSINDVPVESLSRTMFEEIKPYYPTHKITFDYDDEVFGDINSICPMAKGSRAIVNAAGAKLDVIKKVLNVFTQKNGIRTLLVSVDDSPEDINSILFDCPDAEVCQLSHSQTRQEFFKEVEIYIRNCVNRLECGENVALVFYNAQNFQNSFMQNLIVANNMTECTAKILAFDKMKDVFNLARSSDDSSFTIVEFDADENMRKFANCQIDIGVNEEGKPFLNKQTSITMNADKIN